MATFEVGVEFEQGVEETKFPVLPAAEYEAEIIKWEAGQSQKGDPLLIWDIEVVNKPEGMENMFPLKLWTPLTGRGRNFLTRLFMAADRRWAGKQVDPDVLIGCRIKVSTSITQGEKGKFARIDAVAPLAPGLV